MDFIRAESKEHLSYIKELFKEYADSLGFDLCFQNFEKELSDLPGEYAPPNGSLLLGMIGNQVAGCVALRKIDEDSCEMKRLYVKPEFRRKRLGKCLAEAIIKEASKIGYKYMRLDTVPSMKEAIMLYESLGFKWIKPYRHNPINGAIFMELDLTQGINIENS